MSEKKNKRDIENQQALEAKDLHEPEDDLPPLIPFQHGYTVATEDSQMPLLPLDTEVVVVPLAVVFILRGWALNRRGAARETLAILQSWAAAHPYLDPTLEEREELERVTGLMAKQVSSWFAARRSRWCPLNWRRAVNYYLRRWAAAHSLHPTRQEQEDLERVTGFTAQEVSRWFEEHHVRNQNRYPREVLAILQGWAAAHSLHPTREEREGLTRATGLMAKQVSSWFAAHRRRTRRVNGQLRRPGNP